MLPHLNDMITVLQKRMVWALFILLFLTLIYNPTLSQQGWRGPYFFIYFPPLPSTHTHQRNVHATSWYVLHVSQQSWFGFFCPNYSPPPRGTTCRAGVQNAETKEQTADFTVETEGPDTTLAALEQWCAQGGGEGHFDEEYSRKGTFHEPNNLPSTFVIPAPAYNGPVCVCGGGGHKYSLYYLKIIPLQYLLFEWYMDYFSQITMLLLYFYFAFLHLFLCVSVFYYPCCPHLSYRYKATEQTQNCSSQILFYFLTLKYVFICLLKFILALKRKDFLPPQGYWTYAKLRNQRSWSGLFWPDWTRSERPRVEG